MRRRRQAARRAPLLFFLSALGSACAELPRVASNECGNGVVEVGEDCDTFASADSFVCRPKGSAGECRLDCTADVSGERAACPLGWGCDESGLCREPTGGFKSAKNYPVGPVSGLVAGDFDGDGRADIISREPTDALQHSKIAFHYFDERGSLVETRAFPKSLTAPLLLDVSGDRYTDLVFSDYRVGLLLGREDRRLVPETFSSYRLPDTKLRMVGVYDGFIYGASSLVVFAMFEGVPSISIPDSATATLRSLGELPGPIEEAVADPIAGNIIENDSSPCAEIVVAMPGASSFLLFDVCERDRDVGDPTWRERAERQEVPIVGEAEVDGAPVIVDVNGDHHLDVLIGAAGRAYVAYGDGAKLLPAEPFSIDVSDFDKSGEVSELPLAAGDVSGDGTADFVFPDRIVVSIPRFGGGAPRYEVSVGNVGEPWTVARIADLNGTGNNGVVAASNTGLGIDVHNGTGSRYLTITQIATEQPVVFLQVGDFDGDLTNDLAIAERAAPGETRDSLSIAFGSVGRPPSNPVPVARLLNPEQLCVYRVVARGNMVVASSQSEASPVGLLTLLDGSADRIPFAPHSLVSFSDDGNLMDNPAISLLAGEFLEHGQYDVVAVGSSPVDYQFWLVPDLEAGRSTPMRLVDGTLDAELSPVADQQTSGRLRLSGAAADIDGDGRDEALWALPNKAGRCTLLSFGVALREVTDEQQRETRTAPAFIPRGAIELRERCEDPQLATYDLDADGALDILLLSGDNVAQDRKLSVFWNDGAGGFAAQATTQVNDRGHQPEGVAILRETTARPLSIAYVTEREGFLSSALADTRSFGTPRSIAQLGQGNAVATADINGDGAEDLVFADGSKITTLLAELKTP